MTIKEIFEQWYDCVVKREVSKERYEDMKVIFYSGVAGSIKAIQEEEFNLEEWKQELIKMYDQPK